MPANELPQIQAYTTASNEYNLDTFAGNIAWPQATRFFDPTITTITSSMPSTSRRIVQVFIADPNENVPLEKSLLYQDEKPHLTDLTDQELFFELDIKGILESHNGFRTTVVDKEASEGKNKDVMLEPAKIRDLKMTVVNVATF